jgi:hypothetical protein
MRGARRFLEKCDQGKGGVHRRVAEDAERRGFGIQTPKRRNAETPKAVDLRFEIFRGGLAAELRSGRGFPKTKDTKGTKINMVGTGEGRNAEWGIADLRFEISEGTGRR